MIFSQQSPAVQHLLNKMRKVGWGRIEELEVRGGEPVNGSQKLFRKDKSLCRKYTSSPYRPNEVLKPHVHSLVEEFKEMQDGIIPLIRIQDGLPLLVELDEEP